MSHISIFHHLEISSKFDLYSIIHDNQALVKYTIIKMEQNHVLQVININPEVLKQIDVQTEQMCLVAVEQNGMMLQHVRKQTSEICLKAVSQNGRALQFVDEHFKTYKICSEAIRNNKVAIYHCMNHSTEFFLKLVKEDIIAFEDLPEALFVTRTGNLLYNFMKEYRELKNEVKELRQQVNNLENSVIEKNLKFSIDL